VEEEDNQDQIVNTISIYFCNNIILYRLVHFVSPDQRGAVNERGGPTTATNQPTTTAGPTQTGK